MKRARQICQALFLVLFLFLFIQTESTGNDELGYPVKLFLDFDPLIFLTTLLSAHSVPAMFFLSLVTIVITILLGRVFCGWICPMGTIHNLVGLLKKRRKLPPLQWHHLKYLLLVFLFVSSLFTMQLSGLLDPLSLLIRSFSLSIYPVFNLAINNFFNRIYELNPPGIVLLSENIFSLLKDTVLSFKQPYFQQGFFIGILFLVLLLLNLVEKRFWCRYLCPLGALLGLLSRFSLLKRSVSEGCNECGMCATVCPGNAAPDSKEQWQISECYNCWNCDDVCPNNAVQFGFSFQKKNTALNLGRRRVITAAASGIIAAPLLRSVPVPATTRHHPLLIRPPGALPEKDFLSRCVKCGECMKVCTTNGLQPTLLEAGIEGIWSPMLVPKLGYCEYRCTLCGQVCPTGAITKLTIAAKAKTKIGLAMVDKSRCLPWAHARPCIVCEEVCPTPKKAIWLEETLVLDRQGQKVRVQRPVVDLDLCIGCGICETKCPVSDQAAIYVTSVGESRSEENQLLL